MKNEQSEAEHVDLSVFAGLQVEEDGTSAQRPVLIDAQSSHVGVPLEYAQLRERFGTMGVDWSIDSRSRGLNTHGRTVESFRLSLKDGSKVDFHFDVSGFINS
jgi:hypothetical protein